MGSEGGRPECTGSPRELSWEGVGLQEKAGLSCLCTGSKGGAREESQEERDWVGFACGRAGGAGRASLTARGNVGTVASKQWGGERVGRGATLAALTSPRCFRPQELPQTPAHGRQPAGEGPE